MEFLKYVMRHKDFPRSLFGFIKALPCTVLFYITYKVLIFLFLGTQVSEKNENAIIVATVAATIFYILLVQKIP